MKNEVASLQSRLDEIERVYGSLPQRGGDPAGGLDLSPFSPQETVESRQRGHPRAMTISQLHLGETRDQPGNDFAM